MLPVLTLISNFLTVPTICLMITFQQYALWALSCVLQSSQNPWIVVHINCNNQKLCLIFETVPYFPWFCHVHILEVPYNSKSSGLMFTLSATIKEPLNEWMSYPPAMFPDRCLCPLFVLLNHFHIPTALKFFHRFTILARTKWFSSILKVSIIFTRFSEAVHV